MRHLKVTESQSDCSTSLAGMKANRNTNVRLNFLSVEKGSNPALTEA